MDWLARPPEVNSALIYTGPGAAPLTAAAAAWSSIAASLYETAATMGTTWGELMSTWSGPSYTAATTAIHSYISWITMTAGQADHTANLASAAASAFEETYAMTIPPPVVAQNRTRLATLVTTNFLGINTPAIMATEAEYAEYWVQDATAITTYFAQSTAITNTLPKHAPAPQTTNPTPQATQTALGTGNARALTTNLIAQPNAVGSGTTPIDNFLSNPLIETLNGYGQNIVSGGAFNPTNIAGLLTGGHDFFPGQYPDTLEATPRNLFSEPEAVAAGVAPPQTALGTSNSASKIGALSVPNSWTTQPGTLTSQTTPISALNTTSEGAAPGTAGMPGMYGAPGTNRGIGQQPRYGYKPTVIARPPSGG